MSDFGQLVRVAKASADVLKGGFDRPDATEEAFDGDWFRTGDAAIIDEEGYLFIIDRIKDIVIRGGENIGCGAVEFALCEHRSILEACVYAVPDKRLGEEVAATIYVSEEIDETEIQKFLAEHLARFEIPKYFQQVMLPLPRIASGKIDKGLLRNNARTRITGNQ